MTLGDILDTSKLSTNELTKKITFRSLRNSIEDCLSMYKRNFMSVIEDTIKGIANGSLYNSGCCVYNQNREMNEISEEDKKDLIKKVKEQAEKTIENFKDTVNSFEDIKSNEPEHKEVEVNIQVQKPDITPVATTVNKDYFGY